MNIENIGESVIGQWSEAKGWDSKCPLIIYLNLYFTCILYLHLYFCVCIWLVFCICICLYLTWSSAWLQRSCKWPACPSWEAVDWSASTLHCCTIFPCYLAGAEIYNQESWLKRAPLHNCNFSHLINRRLQHSDLLSSMMNLLTVSNPTNLAQSFQCRENKALTILFGLPI